MSFGKLLLSQLAENSFTSIADSRSLASFYASRRSSHDHSLLQPPRFVPFAEPSSAATAAANSAVGADGAANTPASGAPGGTGSIAQPQEEVGSAGGVWSVLMAAASAAGTSLKRTLLWFAKTLFAVDDFPGSAFGLPASSELSTTGGLGSVEQWLHQV